MKALIGALMLMAAAAMAQTANSNSAPAPAPAAPQATATLSPEKIAQLYIDYWNTGNFEPLKPYASLFYMTSQAHKVVVDTKTFSRVVTTWRGSIPNLNLKVMDTIFQGDKVVMDIVITGTYKTRMFANTIQPIPEAPPRNIRVGEILIFQVKDGKIFQVWEQYDELAMRIQMGAQWVPNDRLDAQQAKEYPAHSAKAGSPETTAK